MHPNTKSRFYFLLLLVIFTYLSRFVVHITIGKHKIEVGNAFFCGIVVIAFKFLLDCSQVHWVFDNVEIILHAK